VVSTIIRKQRRSPILGQTPDLGQSPPKLWRLETKDKMKSEGSSGLWDTRYRTNTTPHQRSHDTVRSRHVHDYRLTLALQRRYYATLHEIPCIMYQVSNNL